MKRVGALMIFMLVWIISANWLVDQFLGGLGNADRWYEWVGGLVSALIAVSGLCAFDQLWRRYVMRSDEESVN